jgi:hypothetical protein
LTAIFFSKLVVIDFIQQAGFVKHGAEFRRNGTLFDPSLGFQESEHAVTLEDDDCIEVGAERIGLGPGVHMWVSCFRKDDQESKIDEFQAFFPCELGKDRNDAGLRWPGPEYTDMNMGDLAKSLEQIFLDRNPGRAARSKPSLRLYGRWLSSVESGRDAFRDSSGEDELHSERMELFLDLKPA